MSFSGAFRPVRTGAVAVAALALVATVTACGAVGGEQDSDGETRVFEADNGKVTIPADPERVVATGYAVPALIETNAPLVGISSWKRGIPLMSDEDLETYEDLPKIAGEAAAETNYEAIAEKKPDLIVIGVPAPVLKDVDMDRLESLAPVVAIGPTLPKAWRTLSQKQADAAGSLENFDEVKAEYERKAKRLEKKYAKVLPQLELAHVGSYGEVGKGSYHREFDGSWGTNIANDIGAKYYGEVEDPGPGSDSVSEYPSIEVLPSDMTKAEAITYSVEADGSVPEAVKYVQKSKLWKDLPAVKAGKTFPIRYTEAATYGQASKALDAIDKSFAPLLEKT